MAKTGKDSPMAKRPPMTKSPLALAKLALQTAQEVLPKYSDIRSRHDYTQAQLFTVLVLRQFFNTDYRGIVELLQEHRQIRNALGLTKIPTSSFDLQPDGCFIDFSKELFNDLFYKTT
jgi:hypothetical protein